MPLIDDDGKWIRPNPRTRRPGHRPAGLPSFEPSRVWTRSGVFVRDLGNFNGDKQGAAHMANYRALALLLDHHPPEAIAHSLRELDAHRPRLTQWGWDVCGWSTYGQGDSDPYEDGVRAARLTANYHLAGWIANGEKWAEGHFKFKTQLFMSGWLDYNSRNRGGIQPPLMLSCLSSDTGNYGVDMDFLPFLRYPGAMISPQAYAVTDPGYTISAMYASYRKTIVRADRLIPTIEVKAGVPVPASYRHFLGPRWLWTGDDCNVNQYALT